MNSMPNCPHMNMKPVRLAVRKSFEQYSVRSSMGARMRVSKITSSTKQARPPSPVNSTSGELQPSSGPRESANNTPAMPKPENTNPAGSNLPASGSRCSLSTSQENANDSIP